MAPMWQFMFDHPYWAPEGDSIYAAEGLPEAMPAWCGIGAGSATIREGTCDAPAGC